ncbi:hypothetical protein [Cohnella fermenti]|uniref:Uncharacterized protein n=1 Tax=Cohnella fermenti TaxID=2565925 RepID=A0A4S4BHR1_9BACL|nr:hypothetical protein [Cohnella fermenti]THF74122.1 hypothetical protein E6C55_26195 [Cohnella fermenti]
MIIVSTHSRIAALEQAGFPSSLVTYIRSLIAESIEAGEPEEHFLSDPVYLCEPGDSILLLLKEAPYGLEYFERIPLADLAVYRVGVLFDSDFIVQYVIPSELLDERTEAWLNERMDIGGAGR